MDIFCGCSAILGNALCHRAAELDEWDQTPYFNLKWVCQAPRALNVDILEQDDCHVY